MTGVQAVLLGMLQGITEFLPISSSGHLVVVPQLLGWSAPSVTFDVFAHLGTGVAVVTYFRREVAQITRGFWASVTGSGLQDPHGRLAWLVLIGIAPALLVAAVFQTFFERLFEAPGPVAGGLMFTGIILLAGDFLAERTRAERHLVELQATDGVLIGLMQVLAIVPGISRSGMTIAAGGARGLTRRAAARYSFLMFMPLVLAATAAKAMDAVRTGAAEEVGVVIAGFAASAVAGYAALLLLLRFLQKGRLTIFAVYCLCLGTVVMILTVSGLLR